MSSARAGGSGTRRGLVGREVTHDDVGTLLVLDGDLVGHDDADLGGCVELLTVEAFVLEALFKDSSKSFCHGRALVDFEDADAAVGQSVADGAGDEFVAFVGAACTGTL